MVNDNDDDESDLPHRFMDPGYIYNICNITDEPPKCKRTASNKPLLAWVPKINGICSGVTLFGRMERYGGSNHMWKLSRIDYTGLPLL